MDPFIGELQPFAFGRIPSGWLPCDGRLLQIQSNPALFSLLGTTYGGDGSTTFALPDLRGRAPLGMGQGGGRTYPLGLRGGSESVTLVPDHLPTHNHLVQGSNAPASTDSPNGATLAAGSNAYAAPAANATLNAAAVAPSGASVPHENMQPSLAVNWCIATIGIYPSRD